MSSVGYGLCEGRLSFNASKEAMLDAVSIYNIGNDNPENLLDFVETLQRVLVEEGAISAERASKQSHFTC